MENLREDEVKALLEGSSWGRLGISLTEGKKEDSKVVEEDSNEDGPGFYELDEGILVYLSENGTLFDVLTDEDENVFLFHESDEGERSLFQAYEDNDGLLFEEVDAGAFQLISEEAEEDEETEK